MICIHADTVVIYNNDDNASCGESKDNGNSSDNSKGSKQKSKDSDSEEGEPPDLQRKHGLKRIR